MVTLSSIDQDLTNLTRRHERALGQNLFDLADALRAEMDRLLDARHVLRMTEPATT